MQEQSPESDGQLLRRHDADKRRLSVTKRYKSRGRGALFHCWWDCKLVQLLQCGRSLKNQKLIYQKIQLYDPLAYPPEESPSYYRDTCSSVFIDALLIIASNCKNSRCSSTYLMSMWYIYTMEYHSAVRTKMTFAGNGRRYKQPP